MSEKVGIRDKEKLFELFIEEIFFFLTELSTTTLGSILWRLHFEAATLSRNGPGSNLNCPSLSFELLKCD
jgi:hypothetical protein